jgi:hypothetical protein
VRARRNGSAPPRAPKPRPPSFTVCRMSLSTWPVLKMAVAGFGLCGFRLPMSAEILTAPTGEGISMRLQSRTALQLFVAASVASVPIPAFTQALVTHRIPAALAVEAAMEAVNFCAKDGYQESAVVVDPAAHIRQKYAATARPPIRSIAPTTKLTPLHRSNGTHR